MWGKRKPGVGGLALSLFFFLLLRPLRFPPVLTWLRLYNSPERVTSSRVKIPGLLFFLSPPLLPFLFFPFYWKGGEGAAVIVEHLSGCHLRRQGQTVIYGNICKMLLYTLLIVRPDVVVLEIEERGSDWVLWAFMESVL